MRFGLIIAIAFVLLIPSFAFAQSYTGVLSLNPISSNVNSGDIITFSGTLTTTNGGKVTDALIYIKDDVAFDTDTIIKTVTTDSTGKFSTTWKAIPRSSGSYDFYAIYEGGGDVSKVRTGNIKVTVSGSGPANSNLSSYSESSTYSTAKITLDPVVSTANVGQTITFTGKLTDNGKGLSGKTIEIKDEDLADFDDYLVSAITDSNGRFSASWKVHETESTDRKNGSVLVELLQPELIGLSKVNGFLNKLELNTVEIFAAYEESNASVSPNTCSLPSSGSSQSYCQNNVIVIKGVDSGIEDEIVSALLGEIVPGGTATGNFDLEDELYNAIQSELGITEDMSMQEMLNLLDDPSLASSYKTTSSVSTKTSSSGNLSSDYDGDGIPDYRDDCKYTQENFNGYQDTDGCFDVKLQDTTVQPILTSSKCLSYYTSEQYTQAINCYTSYLKTNPTDVQAIVFLGTSYEGIADFNSALTVFQKLNKLFPNDPNGWYGMARNYSELKECEKAVMYYEKVIEISPDHLPAKTFLNLQNIVCPIGTGSSFFNTPEYETTPTPKITSTVKKQDTQIDFSINMLNDEIKIFEGVELEGKLYYISPKGNEIGVPHTRVQLKSYDGFSVIESLPTDYAGNFKWESFRNSENYDKKTGVSSWDLYLYFDGNDQYNIHSAAIGHVEVQNPDILPISEITESEKEEFCFLFWCW